MHRRHIGLWIAAILWSAVVAGGFFLLNDYAARPSASAAAPPRWPSACRLTRPAGAATLLVFLHPRCPCSRASVEQLRWVLERTQAPLTTYVLLATPPGAPAGWDATALSDSVAFLPGVVVAPDIDQSEARRFRARTSGQALLYDAAGELAFAGGLTASRGHQGVNVASGSLLALLSGQVAPPAAPVFGCPLSSESQDE